MILSTRPYSAKLRKLRRRLRDHRWSHPRIASRQMANWSWHHDQIVRGTFTVYFCSDELYRIMQQGVLR